MIHGLKQPPGLPTTSPRPLETWSKSPDFGAGGAKGCLHYVDPHLVPAKV